MTFINEFIRWFLRAFVFPILTLLIILIVAINLIPQTELRGYAAEQIGKRLDRQLEIGPIHWGLRGLAMDSLKVSEVPNFKFGMLFAAEGIRLGWDLRSLWQGLDVRKRFVTKSNGQFHIDDFHNPHYQAHDFSMRWSLRDMDPSMSHVTGWAKLDQGPGMLLNIDQLMAASPSAKIALAPVLALMNLEKLGVLNLGLPDLKHWPIQDIRGNYEFKNGLMTLKEFTLHSQQLSMGTTGTIDLTSGRLQLDVGLHAPKKSLTGALDASLRMTGTTSHPQVDLTNLKKKAFRATVTEFLKDPQNAKQDINNAIKNLFH